MLHVMYLHFEIYILLSQFGENITDVTLQLVLPFQIEFWRPLLANFCNSGCPR